MKHRVYLQRLTLDQRSLLHGFTRNFEHKNLCLYPIFKCAKLPYCMLTLILASNSNVNINPASMGLYSQLWEIAFSPRPELSRTLQGFRYRSALPSDSWASCSSL